MGLSSTRIDLNTNGMTPLADAVPAGAPGTVTGDERLKLQQILNAAKQMATGALDGLMSAAHYAMLAAATSANVANALVRRDGNGDFTARIVNATSFVGALSGNASTASALLAGTADRIKLDGIQAGAQVNPAMSPSNFGNYVVQRDASGNFSAGTITASLNGNATSANSANTASTAGSATSASTASFASSAGDLSPTLNRGSGTEGNGWAYSYDASGKRHYVRYITATPAASPDQNLGTIGTPNGLGVGNQVVIVCSAYGVNANQISASIRGGGNTAQLGATTIDVVVSTTDGTNLNTKNAGHVGVMLIAKEI